MSYLCENLIKTLKGVYLATFTKTMYILGKIIVCVKGTHHEGDLLITTYSKGLTPMSYVGFEPTPLLCQSDIESMSLNYQKNTLLFVWWCFNWAKYIQSFYTFFCKTFPSIIHYVSTITIIHNMIKFISNYSTSRIIVGT